MDAYVQVLARRSVRVYQPDPVADDLVLKVLDAGRLAPTARNEQPWTFVVVKDPERRAALAKLAENGPFLADAPVCIVVLCQPTKYYLEDGAAATTQMLIAAATLGLGSCWVAGDKKAYAAEVVRLVGAPADHKLVAMIALGYAHDIPAPSKRTLEDVAHWETY